MAASQLSVYNEALRICGERALASLTENREPRHLLDAVWAADGVRGCLEQAQWKHAMRTIMVDYDPDITTDFGYRFAFVKPTDWVLTSAVSADEYFAQPLTQYNDEAGYWYCELQLIYVRYVSDAASYGSDFGLWPRSFSHFVATKFAAEICFKLTGDKTKQEALTKRGGLLDVALSDAKSRDAMADPSKTMPQGSWTASRTGRNLGDRGRRGQLIG